MKNKNLQSAKKNKNDEFYTQLTDIEKELKYYRSFFKDKIIFCNCDDPEYSNFWKYFQLNFDNFGLKRLISTHFNQNAPTYKLELLRNMNDEPMITKTQLNQNGDFRSSECIELLKEADIIITNPPFSLYREYVEQLMEYEKKFIIIGNKNSITYKEIFPLIKENKIWIGHRSMNSDFWLRVPDDHPCEKIVDGVRLKHIMACWFTNLDIDKRHEKFILFREYSPDAYPKYDNYDAINVDKVSDIPCDYYEVMGVPITFLDKYCPEQFEILGTTESEGKGFAGDIWLNNTKIKQPLVNGERKYKRIFIKRKS